MIETIVKNDGSLEPFDSAKLFKWAEWACSSVSKYVDWGKVVLTAVNGLPKVCKSSMLQYRLIDTCKDMNTWSYYKMAGRLYASQLNKKIYPNGKPTVQALHRQLINLGLMIEIGYTDEEYAAIETLIEHDRDYDSVWFGLAYINGKYAIRDATTNRVYETQQFVYMRMAMALASDEKEDKLLHVENWYKYFKKKIINAPTPNYVNLGTPLRGLASCCVYTTKDTAGSLAAGDHIAYVMTCISAGNGNQLQTRTIGDPVRGGRIKHRGKLFYYKAVVAATQANMQGGRGGAATGHFSVYDPEVIDILQARNPRQTEDKRIRGMHFGMQTNKTFARLVADDLDYSTFSMRTQPDLHKSFFGDGVEFDAKYKAYLESDEAKRRSMRARDSLVTSLTEAFETGTAYLSWIDEMNRHTASKDPIISSNLCVAPETEILTKEGYVPIIEKVDQTLDIWNGEEWSEVTVVKTGENQKLLRVTTSDGQELDCTDYHNWYIIKDYGGKPIKKPTKELEVGDKLIKFDLPIIEGTEELPFAYDSGFFTGDGYYDGNITKIYLYGEKKLLKDKLKSVEKWYDSLTQDRSVGTGKGLLDKYDVPLTNYTIKSRLEWLAGILDSDGCVYRNLTNESLTMSSSNRGFLRAVQLMLQTLGVRCVISKLRDQGYYELPANDGSGKMKKYACLTSYRLLITSGDSQRLLDLGLELHRLKIEKRKVQRDAKQFVTIREISNKGRVDDTYCFTEHKRNMGMFNGILTGQCLETSFPSNGYDSVDQLYSTEFINSPDGLGEQEPEIGLCSLAAINVANVDSDAEYAEAAYYALKMIDKCIHITKYPFPHLELTAKARMNAGIGIVGLAYLMAKNQQSYMTRTGKAFIHTAAETHAWHVINASLRLGKELGNAPWMPRTKWPEGWLPIDTYCKAVDNITPNNLTRDWEGLRGDIIANKGIRNSCLMNHMPSESSSKASETTNSVYPVRDLSLIKTDDTVKIYWAAPDSDRLKYDYEMAWDVPTRDLIDDYAIIQKFTDQGISADMYRKVIDDEVIYTDEIIGDYLYMTEVGMKSRYYQNSKTSSGELQIEESCGDSCKL